MNKPKQAVKKTAVKKLSIPMWDWEESMMYDDHGSVVVGDRKQKPQDLEKR